MIGEKKCAWHRFMRVSRFDLNVEGDIQMIERQCDRLIWARKSVGLTQRSFAKRIEVTSQLVSMMENGKTKLSHQTAKRIEYEFGINHEWLLTGVGDMLVPKKIDSKSPIVSVFESFPEIHKLMCGLVERLTVAEWYELEKICAKLNGTDGFADKAS